MSGKDPARRAPTWEPDGLTLPLWGGQSVGQDPARRAPTWEPDGSTPPGRGGQSVGQDPACRAPTWEPDGLTIPPPGGSICQARSRPSGSHVGARRPPMQKNRGLTPSVNLLGNGWLYFSDSESRQKSIFFAQWQLGVKKRSMYICYFVSFLSSIWSSAGGTHLRSQWCLGPWRPYPKKGEC